MAYPGYVSPKRSLIQYKGSFALGCSELAKERDRHVLLAETPLEARRFASRKAHELGVSDSFVRRCLKIADFYGNRLNAIAYGKRDTVFYLTKDYFKELHDTKPTVARNDRGQAGSQEAVAALAT